MSFRIPNLYPIFLMNYLLLTEQTLKVSFININQITLILIVYPVNSTNSALMNLTFHKCLEILCQILQL